MTTHFALKCLDGLGQLTDGVIAGDDYRLTDNVQGIGQLGYDWIGWRRKASAMSNINLTFSFDTVRNVTSIRLHTSNLFTRDIYIFNSIIITSCGDKIPTRTFFLIPDDYVNTRARFINISLTSGSGLVTKCLQLTLTFNNRSKWILISEVVFSSVAVSKNVLSAITTAATMDTNHHLPPLIGNREWFDRLRSACQ